MTRCCTALLALCLAGAMTPLFAQEPPAGAARVVTAAHTDTPIAIDGALDEAAWATAAPTGGFVQKDPAEGKPATEETEVRVLYDRDNLYIGVRCHDRSPSHTVGRDIARDFDYLEQDSFGILIDTFRDRRSGFMFATTPHGGQLDIQILNENRDVNTNWDGVWRVETTIDDQGWTAEFAIPFKTLRFSREDTQDWGIQFFRRIRSRNEIAFWSPVPRRYNVFQISRSGVLQGLQRLRPGKNLTVKPYVAPEVSRFDSRRTGTSLDLDGGVDMKYGVTSGLTLDLTVNTDFSQVEVDTQQVNLTRFPLFFPEKREFFLENSGLFQLGETYRIGPPRSEETLLFFSRRVGLSPDREPIPLLGGARLTGRAGPYYLGLMNLQTRSEGAVPANNFTVARLRRDIPRGGDLGVMFINRQSERAGDSNRAFGADVNLLFGRDLQVNGTVAATRTPGKHDGQGMQKVEALWRNNVYHLLGSYLRVEENFNPEVGFVRRRGTILHNEQGVRARLGRDHPLGAVLRDLSGSLLTDFAYRPSGDPETSFVRPNFRFEFQDGAAVELQYWFNFDGLRDPFAIRKNVVLPARDYHYRSYVVWYYTNKSKPASIDVKYYGGDFYEGRKSTWKIAGRVQPGYRFSAGVDLERNDVVLPQGTFLTSVVGLRGKYSFSPRLVLNALIQYNSDTKQVNSNIRFRFTHRPLSDIYVVYNEQHDVTRNRNDRALTLKFTQLIGL